MAGVFNWVCSGLWPVEKTMIEWKREAWRDRGHSAAVQRREQSLRATADASDRERVAFHELPDGTTSAVV
jgi:hypothetical protein